MRIAIGMGSVMRSVMLVGWFVVGCSRWSFPFLFPCLACFRFACRHFCSTDLFLFKLYKVPLYRCEVSVTLPKDFERLCGCTL